jgi:hypothetical protein
MLMLLLLDRGCHDSSAGKEKGPLARPLQCGDQHRLETVFTCADARGRLQQVSWDFSIQN